MARGGSAKTTRFVLATLLIAFVLAGFAPATGEKPTAVSAGAFVGQFARYGSPPYESCSLKIIYIAGRIRTGDVFQTLISGSGSDGWYCGTGSSGGLLDMTIEGATPSGPLTLYCSGFRPWTRSLGTGVKMRCTAEGYEGAVDLIFRFTEARVFGVAHVPTGAPYRVLMYGLYRPAALPQP